VTLVMLSIAAEHGRVSAWIPLCGCVGLCGFLGLQLGSFDSETAIVSKPIPPAQLEQSLNQSVNQE
jgi:hypothetical protein